MTVAIVLQVHDGVVLASDSAMTLTDPTKVGPESVLNVYNNANKIYNLRKGLPIGGLAYGWGSLGSSSLATLAKDLRWRFSGEQKNQINWQIDPDNYTIKDIADRAREFLFDEHFKPLNVTTGGMQLGFIVAGYSSGAQLSEVWSIVILPVDISNGSRLRMPWLRLLPKNMALIPSRNILIARGDHERDRCQYPQKSTDGVQRQRL
jgi:hypothetical protein